MIILLARFGSSILSEILKMEWLNYFLVFVVIIFLISICDELNDRFKRIPFGPLRIPLFGNYFQLQWKGGKYPYRALTKMAKGYAGGFMKIFFGLTGYVSVNGHAKISEIVNKDDWAGERDEIWRLDRTEKDKKTISSMMIWVSRRNIAIRCLKDHTFSRKEMLTNLIQKQVQDLLEGIQIQEDMDRHSVRELHSDIFLPYALSSVWSVLTGDPEMSVKDRRVQTIHRCLKEWETKTVEFSSTADYLPFLVNWFPGWTGFNKLKETNEDLRRCLKSLIKEQYTLASTNKNPGPETFVQACIREFKDLRKQSFGETQMNDSSSIALLFEFLCPGPLILSSNLGFALSLAARDPVAQNRIVEEIDAVFGMDKIPSVEKMDRMPFTKAFILEASRIASVVPWERRKLFKDVREGDVRYPRNMSLLLNYHSANFDPTVWEAPEVFEPERFLKDGKIVNENKLLALAAEKHLCAGQPLLRMILFSFLTGLLQKYKFELYANYKDQGPEWGIVNRPHPFKVTLKDRS